MSRGAKAAKAAASGLVAAALLFSGSPAEAAERQETVTDVSMRWLCKLAGGVYSPGTKVSYCFLPDGRIIACYPELAVCDTYNPTRNAGAASSASAIGAQEVR